MKTKQILKTVLAIICGEVIMILLITVAQEVIVNGVRIGASPLQDIIIGGTGTIISGIIAGFVSTFIGGISNRIPAIGLTILVIIETTLLIVLEKINNPIWFDASAALSLIGAIWVGYYLFQKLKNRRLNSEEKVAL